MMGDGKLALHQVIHHGDLRCRHRRVIVGEHNRFALFAKNVPIGANRRVDWLYEKSELQGACIDAIRSLWQRSVS